MDPESGLHVVGEPVVHAADPFGGEEIRTAELPRRGVLPFDISDDPDPLVPPLESGLAGWVARVGRLLFRTGIPLLLIAGIALIPTHFFVGRVDDTLIAAPALSDLAGGFGLVLLPIMWLAYFAVSALPLVICVAGVVGVVLPACADGVLPGLRTIWRSVAQRLRTLWLWFVPFGLLAQSLPLVLNTERLGETVAIPLALCLGVASTAGLTVMGMLGCAALIERGGLRRALRLLSVTPCPGLIGGAFVFTVFPRVAGMFWGALAASIVGALCGVLWAMASLVTYAQARRAEGRVSSVSLRRELDTLDLF